MTPIIESVGPSISAIAEDGQNLTLTRGETVTNLHGTETGGTLEVEGGESPLALTELNSGDDIVNVLGPDLTQYTYRAVTTAELAKILGRQ